MVETGQLQPFRSCHPRTLLHRTVCTHNKCRVSLNKNGELCVESSEGALGHMELVSDVQLMTFVRRPVDHVMSMYAHCQQLSAYAMSRNPHRPKIGFDAFIDFSMIQENQANRTFCSYNVRNKQTMELGLGNIDAALTALNRMLWVGVTEAYDASICLLRSILMNKPMCACEARNSIKVSGKMEDKSLQEHVNFQGHDLRGVRVHTVRECQLACDMLDACKAFSFITTGALKSHWMRCWLKHAGFEQDAAASSATVSGVKTATDQHEHAEALNGYATQVQFKRQVSTRVLPRTPIHVSWGTDTSTISLTGRTRAQIDRLTNLDRVVYAHALSRLHDGLRSFNLTCLLND
jgi:hypothetical protein